MISINRNVVERRRCAVPFFLQPHALQGRLSRNLDVSPRCTTCIVAYFFWLCARPDFCSGLQPERVMGLGMFRSIRSLWWLLAVDELMSRFQTYNSLNQNPCTVSAYLQATCAGGCEYY